MIDIFSKTANPAYTEELEELLKGSTLISLTIGADKTNIFLITSKGEIVGTCKGDCCSRTWIENVELNTDDLPATIVEIRNLEMPDLGTMKGCDVVQYYGVLIKTDRSDIIIDYRNDSNGYYGGSLEWKIVR